MPSSPSENSFAPLLHALHYFDCSSHCDCHKHHHYHQCHYHLRHCLHNLHLMTSSPPSVTGFALLWLLSQDYSLVSHHPPSYFSAPTWQVASKSLTTDTIRTMMEGTGRKTTDYIWVSLLPCSNFSHRGCYGSSTLYPHISETWQIVQTFKEKLDQYLIWWKLLTSPVFSTSPNWSKTRGSAFHLSPSFTNDQVFTTTWRGRTRPSGWVEPSRNHSLKNKDRQSGPQCVCFVFL